MSFFFLASVSFSFSQVPFSIIGTWKIVAVHDDDLYHHFDKDSTVLSSKFKKELEQNHQDTSATILLAKMGMEMLKNSVFIFKKDSTYQDLSDAPLGNEKGAYTVDYKKGQIFTTALEENKPVKKEPIFFKVNLDGSITISFPDSNLACDLKRVE